MVQLTPSNPYLTLRVKFKKVGSLKYISHLDLVRTMMKIIVRAGLPLWYSPGFNPKPKLIFAAPLSIGTDSYTEYMDIKLIDDMPREVVKERLNANMTDEMQVTEAYYATTKLTDLKWLRYIISIKTLGADSDMAAGCEKALLSDSVIIEKKTKPGEPTVTTNIAPLINSVKSLFSDGIITLDCLLSADQSCFLNPEYVIKALRSSMGILSCPDLTKEYYSITRVGAYRADMTDFH